jgi:hypothetical protein
MSIDGTPQPLSYDDIDAWGRLYDTQPRPWEAQMICRIDRALRAKWRKEREAAQTLADSLNVVNPKDGASVRALTSNLGKRKKGKAT